MENKIICFAFVLLAGACLTQAQQDSMVVSAFPGAMGFGAITTGARGGKVVVVDKLTDSDPTIPGELRYALEEETVPRFVIFKVAGMIGLTRGIKINTPHIYIAGQTAPGDGIIVRMDEDCPGQTLDYAFNIRNTHDIIIRYLQIRLGYGAERKTGDNISMRDCQSVIIDHVSTSWPNDENVGMYLGIGEDAIRDITVQNSIVSEPLDHHPMNFLINCAYDTSNPDNITHLLLKIERIFVGRNLFSHSSLRNPFVAGQNVIVANNLTYATQRYAFQCRNSSKVDFIGNYIKEGDFNRQDIANGYTGPNTITDFYHGLEVSSTEDGVFYKLPPSSLYLNDNVVNRLDDDNNVELFKADAPQRWVDRLRYIDVDTVNFRNTPLDIKIPYTRPFITALEVQDSIIDDIGAFARVNCAGEWESNVGFIDTRILNDVGNRTGLPRPEHQDSVGGYPANMDTGTICSDIDNDGLPDDFETKYFGNDTAAEFDEDPDQDGYSNFEEYINGSDPTDDECILVGNIANLGPFICDEDSVSTKPDIHSGMDASSADIYIYPIPANPFMYIVLPRGFKGATVEIFDMSGRCVANYTAPSHGHMKWATQRFPNGIYLVQVRNAKHTLRRRIVLIK